MSTWCPRASRPCSRPNLPAVDAELSRTLALLGVTIGDGDAWVRATRCGQGALVD